MRAVESPLLNQGVDSVVGRRLVVMTWVEALGIRVVVAQDEVPDFIRNDGREITVGHSKD
jgi:hypothetical protein